MPKTIDTVELEYSAQVLNAVPGYEARDHWYGLSGDKLIAWVITESNMQRSGYAKALRILVVVPLKIMSTYDTDPQIALSRLIR